jgi:uncharacterized membrane protein YgdD (TMEM256/DUF423 family)
MTLRTLKLTAAVLLGCSAVGLGAFAAAAHQTADVRAQARKAVATCGQGQVATVSKNDFTCF